MKAKDKAYELHKEFEQYMSDSYPLDNPKESAKCCVIILAEEVKKYLSDSFGIIEDDNYDIKYWNNVIKEVNKI